MSKQNRKKDFLQAVMIMGACLAIPLSGYAAQTDAAAENKKVDIEIKATRDEAEEGAVKCIIPSLSGTGDEDMEGFLMQCMLPDGAELKSVYTGTYNEQTEISLLYQTEKDDMWHEWENGVSSIEGRLVKTPGSDLLGNDRISAFAVSAEKAPAGFSLNGEDPCYFLLDTGSGSTDLDGTGRISAYFGSAKAESEKSFSVPAFQGVQTGDDNLVFLASVMLLSLSQMTLISYVICRVVFYKKEKVAEQELLPVTYNEHSKRGTHGKMSELLKNKPG